MKTAHTKKTNLKANLSIIILNVNDLNTTMKIQRMNGNADLKT